MIDVAWGLPPSCPCAPLFQKRFPVRALFLSLGFIAASSALSAQMVPRDQYFQYLPPGGRLVSQTRANAALNLYGDRTASSYADADLDGIDDARAQTLHALAARFAPALRRNNFSAPRDIRLALGDDQWLKLDTWLRGRLARSDSIWLGGAQL